MKRILFTVCLFTLFFSCNSDDDKNSLSSQPEASFYALAVGNSWVYKNFQYNSSTTEYDDTGILDHVSIVGTEIIDGESYFKFKTVTTGNDSGISYFNTNGEKFEFRREVDGNLIDESGNIVYTNNNYNERLVSANSWGNIYDRLTQNIEVVTVVAGIFSCLDMERYVKSADNMQTFPGLDHFYYSEGVGLILDSTSFVSQSYPIGIRRLESYTIN